MKKSKSALMRILSLALVMATILALFSVPVSAETYKKNWFQNNLI
jgi:cytochrome P450